MPQNPDDSQIGAPTDPPPHAGVVVDEGATLPSAVRDEGATIPSAVADDGATIPPEAPEPWTAPTAAPPVSQARSTSRVSGSARSVPVSSSTSLFPGAGGYDLPALLQERFSIQRVLGRGGMGIVYLCQDRNLGRLVAIKLIVRQSKKLDTLMEQEARVLAGFVHEHIVRLYDMNRIDSIPYLVMEFVEGQPLSKRLAAGRASLLESVRLAREIVAGVRFAHAHGVAHLDLKPANVLLDETGKAKVADFGLARVVEADSSPLIDSDVKSKAVGGSPGYMPPEQWRGEGGFAADIYAVGVILHEMLAGRALFAGLDRTEMLQLQSHGPIPKPSDINRSVPPVLDQLVLQCLSPQREDRPSIDKVNQVLEDWYARANNPDRRPGASGFPPHPYRFLDCFGVDDYPIFFGREAESTDLAQLISTPSVRLVLVFGPCGIGKSSVLRAGMARAMDPRQFDLAVLIAGATPARRLREELANRAAAAGVTLPGYPALTASLLEAEPRLLPDLASQYQATTKKSLILVLDQSEEVFTQNPGDYRESVELFELIARLVTIPSAPVKLVVAYRTEFRGEFFPLEQRLGQYLHSFPLFEIDPKGLLNAIRGPAVIEAYQFSFETGLAETIAADILRSAKDQGAPALPSLQIICRQLFDKMRAGKRNVIDTDLYEKSLGGASGALRRYVEERLASPTYARQGALARQMLEALTIREGEGERFSFARDEKEVLDFPDTELAIRTLAALIADRLVVADVGSEGQRVVRLASEVICSVIDSWKAEPDPAQSAARVLARSFRLWTENSRNRDYLLTPRQVASIQPHLPSLFAVTPEQRDFVALSASQMRRNAGLRLLAALLLFASLGGLAFATFFKPGTIRLESDPEGVTVTLKGQQIGKTPLIWKGWPGVYELKLTARDYVPVDCTVKISPGGETDLKQFLPYTRGLLEIVTEPPGAFCTVQPKGNADRSVQRTPFTTEYPEGDYSLDISLDGYEAQIFDPIKVRRNHFLTHKALRLVRKTGWVTANSPREGAHLVLTDPVTGRSVLDSPLPLPGAIGVPAGRYRAECTPDRGRVDFQSVEITEKTTTDICPWIPAARTLWRIVGLSATDPAAVADLDGDGIADLVIGSAQGALFAFSGRTGAEIFQFKAGGGIFCTPALVDLDGDQVPDAVFTSHDGNVYAVSGKTGTKLWSFRTGGEVQVVPATGDLNNDGVPDVVVGSCDHRIYALDGKTGRELWHFTTNAKVYANPTLSDLNGDGVPDVVAASDDACVYALDGKNGAKIWSFTTGGSVQAGPIAVRTAGKKVPDFVVAAADHTLYGLSGANGARRFAVRPGAGIDGAPRSVGDIDNDGCDDVVAVSADYNHVVAISGKTGSVLWTCPVQSHLWPRPAVVDMKGDGQRQVVVTGPTRVYVLRAADGRPLWGLNPGEVMTAVPTLADLDGDGTLDLVAVIGNSLLSVPGTLGDHQWSVATAGLIRLRPALADLEGPGHTAVVVAAERRIYAVDGRSGAGLYNRDAAATITGDPVGIPPSGRDGAGIVFSTVDGVVHALRGPTGRPQWSYHAGGAVETRAAVRDLDGDGTADIVVGTDAGAVHAISGATGQRLWQFATAAKVVADPLITDLAGDGKEDVIACTMDGHVHALSGKTGSPRWTYAAGSPIQCAPVAGDTEAVTGRIIYVGTEAGGVYALSGRTGQPIWTAHVPGAVRMGPLLLPIAGQTGGALVLASASGHVHLFNLRGAPLWDYQIRGRTTLPLTPPALVDINGDGQLDILLGIGGELFGLDGTNGEEIYQSPFRYTGVLNPILLPDAPSRSHSRIHTVVAAAAAAVISFPLSTPPEPDPGR